MTVTTRRRANMVPDIKRGGSDSSDGVAEDTTETSFSTPLLTDAGDNSQISIPKDEKAYRIALQVTIPFLLAGLGTVGAGMVLDIVQHWPVFVEVSEIFILVPALLGLKGNLEMTLASRLSTQANLGNMDTRTQKMKMIGGNLMLVQAQALVVGFLAALFAMVMGWIPSGKFDVQHGLLLCASSMLTASLASLILGCLMIGVILGSRRCGIDPDNVATPVAASLGDLITLALLACVVKVVNMAVHHDNSWIAPVLMCILLVLIPVFIYLSQKNEYVSDVIATGWTPIIAAMAISSVGGLVLDMTVSNEKYHGMAVFQPVMNGVGGNLVAVQASRLSTGLHKRATLGGLPADVPSSCFSPFSAFCAKGISAKTARILLSMVVPGHIVFIYLIKLFNAGHTTISIQFLLVYNVAALIQVVILLYVCNSMVHWMWKHGDDPDNFAIPYLTALGDLLGTSLLALAFYILFVTGDRDSDVGD